ncbi:MAG: helix-turn-helix domain-containing protein [Acidimicrobiales bacterium]
MITKTEQVWRHLIVGALEENRRRWDSVTALAEELGLGISTVHRALAHPTEIGAVVLRPIGGVRVLDPGRLLIAWAGRRRLSGDVVRRFRVCAAAPEVEQDMHGADAVLGGFGAVVARLGGNTIADYESVLVYGEPGLRAAIAPDEDGRTVVTVLEPDPLLARYGPTTPLAQSWVDLFNTPGWQAARFVHTLLPRLVTDAVTGLLPV